MTVHTSVLAPLLAEDVDALTLLPSQQAAMADLKALLVASPVIAYCGDGGTGRSVMLKRFVRERNGAYIDALSVLPLLDTIHVKKWGFAVKDYVLNLMNNHELVVFDNYPEILSINGRAVDYFNKLILNYIKSEFLSFDKRLIIAGDKMEIAARLGDVFGPYAMTIDAPAFLPEDYAVFLCNELGESVAGAIDFTLLFKTAPNLDLYQLRQLTSLVAGRKDLTTLDLIICLEQHILRTNLRPSEVEVLDFASLPGTERLAQVLQSHVILPFEQPEMARELNLKPRRGVLLYGPPGTGKTSIGRALAHRIRGRFFLIDGTFVTEPPADFLVRVKNIVEQAKANAPSVLFIDDADVLFQIEHIAGFSRYLLSLLDGVESETASNVCVVMTAMDAQKVPEALLRSGRVELWLETRAPDEATRARILERWMIGNMPGRETVDYAELARETAGFTPADLRRLSADARLLYAADVVAGKTVANAQSYLRQAIADLIALRETMATQLNDLTLRIAA
jgi:transitional endoplasmic reticulum ATPase